MPDFKPQDNIFWLFSSAAQSIAAFIGFLVAGFFFAYERFDKLIEKDETLEEVYASLRNKYFIRLKVLLIMTGASIIFSLASLFLNKYGNYIFSDYLFIGVSLLNVATIITAILFVIFIIDPKKIKKISEELIEENKVSFANTVESVSLGEFMESFVKLEKALRLIWIKEKQAFQNAEMNVTTPLSLRAIVENLATFFRISEDQYSLLIQSIKIRNLAVHGGIDNIDRYHYNLVNQIFLELKAKYPYIDQI